MNVLHVINNLEREGAQVMLCNLAGAAATSRHAVFVRTAHGPLQARLEARGVPVHSPARGGGALHMARTARALEAVAIDEDADVVHAHMADAAVLGWRVARRLSLPLVITHHGHGIVPRCHLLCRSVYRLLLAAAARRAARNVAVSESVAARAAAMLRLAPARIEVIENGVPYPSTPRAPKSGTGDAPTIVSVGRLIELKGQIQLLDAAARLAERVPPLRFVLLGDGPLRDALEARVEALGLAGRFVFAGSVDDVGAWLARAALFVSTSRYEGLPVALLEAMAAGVPVVASDVPGNRSVVRDGATGLSYPLDDVDGLCAAIARTLDDPAAAQARAGAAARMVADRFSLAATVRRYESVYRSVLASADIRGAA